MNEAGGDFVSRTAFVLIRTGTPGWTLRLGRLGIDRDIVKIHNLRALPKDVNSITKVRRGSRIKLRLGTLNNCRPIRNGVATHHVLSF
jgi:hypothetical protein